MSSGAIVGLAVPRGFSLTLPRSLASHSIVIGLAAHLEPDHATHPRCLAKQDRGTAGPPAAVLDPEHRERVRDVAPRTRRVIAMGWIFEGVPLVFAGVLSAAVSLVGDDGSATVTVAYADPHVTAVSSRLPAARNTLIAYRLCAASSTNVILLLAAIATRSPPTSQPRPTAPRSEHA